MPLGVLLVLSAQAAPAEDFVLDEHDWYECSAPSDDTWIIRQTHGTTTVWYGQPEPEPGYLSFMMEFLGLSMPDPAEEDHSRFGIHVDHNPYEIDTYWMLSSAADHPTTSLQNEFHYGWGNPWPIAFNTHQRSMRHTLSGTAGPFHSSTGYSGMILSFCDWDDRTYPDYLPEDCFVGWTLCLSHLRPDRVVFNWTIDASLASRYKEALPKPVMMLHDETDTRATFITVYHWLGDKHFTEYEWVDMADSATDDGVVWMSFFGDKDIRVYYAGGSYDDVWPHLERGGDE